MANLGHGRRLLEAALVLLIGAGLGQGMAFAQSRSIDSLSHRLQDKLNGTERLLTLQQLASAYLDSDPQKGIAAADSALTLARKTHNLHEALNAASLLASLHWATGNYPASAQWAIRVIEQSQTLGDSALLVRGHAIMGGIQGELANYSESLKHQLLALRISDALGFGDTLKSDDAQRQRVASLTANIGTTYLFLRDTLNALSYYQKALGQIGKNPSDPLGLILHNNLSILYAGRGETALARQHNQKALDLAQTTGTPRGTFQALIQKGYLHQEAGEMGRAEKTYKEALALAQPSNPQDQIEIDRTLADFYVVQGRDAQAEALYSRALETGRAHRLKQTLHDVHLSLARLYTRRGMASKAARHWEQVAAYRDSLYSDRLASQSALLSTQYEIDNRVLENTRLKQEKRQQADRIQWQRLIIVLAILSICLLGTLALYHRRVQRRLLRQQEALKQVNRDKDRFFSIIAHDLRHPFQTLTSFIRLMERHAAHFSTEEIVQFTAQLKDNVNTTATLLENLLEWSQNQTGTLSFCPSHMNLTPLVDQVLQQAYASAQAKSIYLANTIEDPILFHADRHMLETVLRNLVSNAIKYTQSSGEVRVGAALQGPQVEIWVQDTGVGMDETVLERLFVLDRRVSTRGTADERGSGLGLILCHEFVQRHGGTISAKSRPGQGTTFTLILPVNRPNR